MTLVIPQDYAAVVHSLVQSGDPEPMAFTYGVHVTDGSTASAVASELDGYADTLMAAFSNQFTLVNTEVTYQDSAPPAPPTIGTKANSQVGSGSDPIAPQNCAYLIHKRSAVGGRGGRGRIYHPGVTEASVNTIGQVLSTTVSSLTTAWDAFRSSIQGGSTVFNMVILHDSNGAWAAEDPVIVTSMQCDSVIATQRRRLRR